ncbi:sigma-54 interaction domain-containing protein [Shouchella patagoniensis]|uniref:sigma-54 interaction domain-containing protein n=1 Tax=Shouchella patagoniensis TaxID=228576 RepID=UPI001FEA9AC2|nr:sigma 54-interacting transcriptional regulator [Shouchella patagoniensis]
MLKGTDSLAIALVAMTKANCMYMEVFNQSNKRIGTAILGEIRQAIQSGFADMPVETFLLQKPQLHMQDQFQSFLESDMFAVLVDSLYDGLYVTDGIGITLKVNKAYERITGIQAKQIIGMHMRDMEKLGYISRSISLEVIKQKQAITRMQRLANGRNAMVSGTPAFNKDGELLFVVSVVRDMTDLLAMQAELEDLKEWQAEIDHHVSAGKGATIVAEDVETVSFLKTAKRVAQTTATVCLLGESGVGKTRVAAFIHEHSLRKEHPFVVVNCGALSEALIESELFGYAPGAFTGALAKGKKGLIEVANGGTLFLDEIGELPLLLQTRLLKVIDELRYTPVGSTELKEVNVRIIAATNQSLQELVELGKLREDLYYRLAVVPMTIKPLRERPKEVKRLIHLFLNEFNERHNRQIQLSKDVVHVLEWYHWPGNIRELKNAIECIVATSMNVLVGMDQLPTHILHKKSNPKRTLKEAVQTLEERLIEKAMMEHGNTRAAAQALGISQSTLVTKRNKRE